MADTIGGTCWMSPTKLRAAALRSSRVSSGTGRVGHRFGIVAVEKDDETLIKRRICRQRHAVDEKADGRPIGIALMGYENDRLAGAIVAFQSMGQEALVPVGPQDVVECPQTLRRPLHGAAPAALQRPLEQPGQHLVERRSLQMVEEEFGHAAFPAIRRARVQRIAPPPVTSRSGR